MTDKPTYEAVRSNAERIADEFVKERVIRGIELLKDEWGEDWVDHVDPSCLVLSSGKHCVLGQLYADATPTEEQWEYAREFDAWQFSVDPTECGGYEKGLVILDGDVLEHPSRYGFLMDDEREDDHTPLQEAWMVAFGRGPE